VERSSVSRDRLADEFARLRVGGSFDPSPASTTTGAAGEALEGVLITVSGEIVTGITTLTDGYSVDMDDGTGALRITVATATGITASMLPRHGRFRVTGVLGQRQSGAAAGYRVHPRGPADIVSDAVPSPSPTSTPMPTPAPSRTPVPSPTASAAAAS